MMGHHNEESDTGAPSDLGRKLIEYGWIGPALLLLFLSFIPFILPRADAIPELAEPSNLPIQAHKHNRVVLIIVDGLGYRKATDPGWMPHFQSRIRMSAFGIALASFPTITPSGLRGILSGHRMVSEPQLPTGIRTPAEIDSVMARAAAAGLKTFVFGQFNWEPLFPNGHGAQVTVIPYNGVSIYYDHGPKDTVNHYDQKILQEAEPILSGKKGKWDFLILHMFESDPIAHSIGTENSLYQNHLMWVDQRIEELSRRLQEQSPTTFLLVADHGQAEDGTHGGLSKTEREVPFMLWGADIKPGKLETAPLYDAAPTLAALLGIPPPALTEGWPRLEAMQTTSLGKADILADLLQQRLERWSTIKAAWPWIAVDPLPQVQQLRHLYELKKYDAAALATEDCIRTMDKTIEDALPKKWLWRLIAAMWCLVFTACFGLAWHQVDPRMAKITVILSMVCLLLIALPLFNSSLWALASGIVLIASGGVMILTLVPGFKYDSGLSWFEWTLWWIALLGMSFQEVLDISLWSWIVVLGLFISRTIHLNKKNWLTSIISLSVVALCAAITSGMRSVDFSLIRSFLPDIHSTLMANLDWKTAGIILSVIMLIASYFALTLTNEAGRPWVIYAFMTAPFAFASVMMLWKPSAASWSWVACAVSLAAMMNVRPSSDIRGMWLSALGVAFYRTMSDDTQWCFFALAVIMGWNLAWKSRDAHPLWEGLGLLGVGLWSYKFTGGDLTFSNLTLSEGYRILGGGWHPYALMTLITLKQLAAIGAPILPRLANRPLNSILGMFPLLGSLTAGNLTMLWWDRFMTANNEKLTDRLGFTRTIFALVLAWMVLALWTAIQGIDFFSKRLQRWKVMRS